jgi:hypothetical protein
MTNPNTAALRGLARRKEAEEAVSTSSLQWLNGLVSQSDMYEANKQVDSPFVSHFSFVYKHSFIPQAVLKEFHQGALEVAEHRELVGDLFVLGDQFDTLEEVVGDVPAPDDPLVAVVEEQKHEVDGEEGKHEVDVPPEEPGPKVGTNVVATKVG